MIVVIDNYDSFVYNLARYIEELGAKTKVVRNDAITLDEIEKINPSHIVISPGPCAPLQAGISMDVIQRFGAEIPVLGVCLGHQAIGQVYGGVVQRAKQPLHGKASPVMHDAKGLFAGLPQPLLVGRYHSLIVAEENFPDALEITARSMEGEVMALQHKIHPVYGVQFHPESVLTECGYQLLKNFMNR